MVVAPRSGREPEEDPVDEERRGDFLQPKPRVPDRARDDIRADGQAEAEEHQPARDHEGQLQVIEQAPLEVALAPEHQPRRDPHRPAGARIARRQSIDRIRPLILSAWGPSSLASLSRYGSAIFWNPDLSVVTTLMPMVFTFARAWLSSSKAFAGSI